MEQIGAFTCHSDKENIILNITLFGEDKGLLMKRIGKLYPDLTGPQKKAVCSLSYKGWGRLSRRFLEGITAPAPETGEVWTIIRTLWETNDNLMQVLSEKCIASSFWGAHPHGADRCIYLSFS